MINRVLGVILLISSLAIGWVWSDYRQFEETPLSLPPEGLVYDLPKGGSAASLGQDLEAAGVLNKRLYFRLLARQESAARHLQAGEYLIPPGTTPKILLGLLSSGRVIQYPITLVEGWNIRELLAALTEQDFLTHTLADVPPEQLMQILGRPKAHPEGRFLPDTYHFPRGTTDLQVLKRAMQAMDAALTDAWNGREPGLPLKNAEEALILASIVEKETGQAAERPAIAGVFTRRLTKGMKLQTDPTVIYGMGTAYKGNIRRKDLRRDTPYNTYVHKGLPPTPIAMPGREAINAVLHPAPGKALYFVAKGDGSHRFSATLKEHNRAVRKYQLKK